MGVPRERGRTGDHVDDASYLREIYVDADPSYTGCVTVPVCGAAGLSVGVSTGYGVLIGRLQEFVPGRVPERADFAAGVLGALGWRYVTGEAPTADG